MLGNGLAYDIVRVGDVQFPFENDSTFTLHDVRHVALLTKNLVSAGQLDDVDDVGYTYTFLEIVHGRSPRERCKLHKD